MTSSSKFMRMALELAREAAVGGDVPVGCVITRGDEVIAKGCNRRERDGNALNHAEIIAVNEACKKLNTWRLSECALYVTLEPCVMCAGAIVNARIPRVVFGAYDAKGGAFGGLLDLNLHGLNHKPEIIGGVMEDECVRLLKEFFESKR